MLESPDEPSLLGRIRYTARKAHASYHPRADDTRPAVENPPTPDNGDVSSAPPGAAIVSNDATTSSSSTSNTVVEKPTSTLSPPAPPPLAASGGAEPAPVEEKETEGNPNIIIRFYGASKEILLSSWINLLLVFVPVGIAVQAAGVNKTIVFAMNAIAIIPLAGLLSHATESVASELGDTIGALMNITFGNAVELIIL